jgi:beta-mannosidase
MRWPLCVLLLTGVVHAAGNPGRVELDLSGWKWQMEGVLPGRGLQEGFDKFPAGQMGPVFLWTAAKIPGDVYTDLWKAGGIDDPNYGRNLEKAKWVMDREWWYTTLLVLPKEMAGKRIRIVFDGIDYECDVWFNGSHLGSHQGMFSSFGFDITRLAEFSKQNRVMIRLAPPPLDLGRFQGKKFFWGGDYFRFASPIGIWRPVRIEATGDARITDVHVESTVDSGGAANVDIDIEIDNAAGRARPVVVSASVKGKNFESAPIAAQTEQRLWPGTNKLRLSVKLPDAKLWWPWDQGKQNLYRAEVTIKDGAQVSDSTGTTFGVRTVRLEMNPGFTKEEVEYPWTVRINGRRHYLRSAAWGGPPSIFYGRTPIEHYRHLVSEAKAGNINNIRIFGWHPPEIKEFYDLCDEAGITVWQGFPFGSAVLPKDPEFMNGALHEVEGIVKERRNHPSLVLWQGGEEVVHLPEHLEGSNLSLMFAIQEAIRPLTNTPFFLMSSLGQPAARLAGFKAKENFHAGGRFYGLEQKSIEEYYPPLDYAIVPELMVTSAPNVASIKKFIPPGELWPPGPSWGYHWADLDVFAVSNFEVFGDTRMGSLEEFVEATQIAQGTEFQFAIEQFRRRKPRTSGTGICHFMTSWPDFKWGIVDYYGERKRSFEMVQRAYQPLLVSLQYSKRRWMPGEVFSGGLWAVNDYYEQYPGAKLSMRVLDKNGKLMEKKSWPASVAPDSAAKIADAAWTLPAGAAGSFTVQLSLDDSGGKRLSSNEYTFLVGDEAEARKARLKLREKYVELRGKYGTSYYRFFPQLTGDDAKRNQ